jgi:hypothetical protein
MKRYGGMDTHRDTKGEKTYVAKTTPLTSQKYFAWGLEVHGHKETWLQCLKVAKNLVVTAICSTTRCGHHGSTH